MQSRLRRSALAGSLAVALAVSGAALAGSTANAVPAAKPAVKKSAPRNTLGVKVVRFAKGTTKAAMVSMVTKAGGTVVTDLSKTGRLAVYAPSSAFDTAIRRSIAVKAVWVDRVIPIRYADAGGDSITGSNDPALGNPGTNTVPDPWHDRDAFLDQNAPGVLQWDDDANGARDAWATTTGDRSVRVAVIDTGVTGSHKEILPNYDNQASANTIPCNLLTRQFGPVGQMDCGATDTEGHGTWVASRIAGAVNGFASNGVAPGVQIIGYKALSTTLGGGLTSWITDAMIRACDAKADLINMSLGGYNRLGTDDEDTLLWVAAVNYCRGKGTAILASAGNEHVRINRATVTVGGVSLVGVGQVDNGDEGIATVTPGSLSTAGSDLRGLLETPAGIPGVIMVSATSNANGEAQGDAMKNLVQKPTAGARDQLAYYSSYGSRIDIAAPGGARRYGVPRYDGGPTSYLYGGWGELGALTSNGEICQDPSLASLGTFACFKVSGAAFGWLQGTSMSAPNATGVAALVLSAKPGLQPDALLSALQGTARTDMVNRTGPNDPNAYEPSWFGIVCSTGFCHVDFANPIAFADAYGAGMVDAGEAVQ